ncbi:fungal-specific transcription factor domain-containing protein [Ilyonectria sp. MPI-CAGE-AT-0026]|nr:fungal-specific transcription factor domain-containing protein [Ilyonectria sp. MPI-CAGE-AT-0026]
MPTLRVRTGCLSCRWRRKKCDERKPICRGCERNKLTCQWPHPNDIPRRRRHNTTLQAPRASRELVQDASSSRQSESRPDSALVVSRSPHLRHPDLSVESTTLANYNDLVHDHPEDTSASQEGQQDKIPVQIPSPSDSSAPSPACSNSSGSLTSSISQETPFIYLPPFAGFPQGEFSDLTHHEDLVPPIRNDDVEALVGILASTQADPPWRSPPSAAAIDNPTFIPRSVSMLPHVTGASFELLSYYLGITSLSMDNGSASTNPFTALLIPLAFSSHLVLHLLLTQSAAHRASRMLDTGETASKYYTRSLQLFQENITKYNQGQRFESLHLTVGALIMCFVETARGDISGTVFDHLVAAQWLLLACLSDSDPICAALKDFLVEYYVYTATLSMVSIDVRVGHQLLLGDELKAHAEKLVSSSYVGSLCGCWLELLLQIPTILSIGRRFLAETEAARPIAADDFAVFANMHNSIESWSPPAAAQPDVALAGRIFQKAMIVYLYTTLQTLPGAADGRHRYTIQTAVDEALSCLAAMPPSARVNTSLCWPIAIVGSCVTAETQKEFLRNRLKFMFDAIGLGNIRQTAVLLDLVWDKPDAGPWNICQVMQEHQIWISFA